MRIISYPLYTFFLSIGIQSVLCQEATVGDSLLLDFYRSQNDPCNICGADDGVLGKGGVLLPAGTAGILQEGRTCAEVQKLALDGYFRPASCLLLPFQLFELCGCISSQPPPVFPPEERNDPEISAPPSPLPAPLTTATTTVFILLEGLDSPLNPESADIFEQVCAEFLASELADNGISDDLTCNIENQTLVVVDPAAAGSSDGDSGVMAVVAGVQLELEITAEMPSSVVDLETLVTETLDDGLSSLVETLQDASDAFNGISGGSLSSTAAPTPAPTMDVLEVDPDGDNDILGIDRDLFIGIASGCGAFLFMIVTLCTCGRGTAGGPIHKRSAPQDRPEQPI